MKRECWKVLGAVVILLGGAGCGLKEKEVTDTARKQAAYLVTEADFAMTLRDYPRAESVLVKVVDLAPDNGAYWLNLGSVRKRLGNPAGAKEAYQRALRAYGNLAKKSDTNTDPWLKQVYVLALLGRTDDSRSLLAKTAKRFPADRNVRVFVEDKQLDQMLADPMYKELAL